MNVSAVTLVRIQGIVYNVTGGPDMTLMEVNAASEAVASIASPDANVIFGAVVDEKYEGQINVTIIATGTEDGIHASDGTQMDTVHENNFIYRVIPRRLDLFYGICLKPHPSDDGRFPGGCKRWERAAADQQLLLSVDRAWLADSVHTRLRRLNFCI